MHEQAIMTACPIDNPSLSASIELKIVMENSAGDFLIPIPMKISMKIEKNRKRITVTNGYNSEI